MWPLIFTEIVFAQSKEPTNPFYISLKKKKPVIAIPLLRRLGRSLPSPPPKRRAPKATPKRAPLPVPVPTPLIKFPKLSPVRSLNQKVLGGLMKTMLAIKYGPKITVPPCRYLQEINICNLDSMQFKQQTRYGWTIFMKYMWTPQLASEFVKLCSVDVNNLKIVKRVEYLDCDKTTFIERFYKRTDHTWLACPLKNGVCSRVDTYNKIIVNAIKQLINIFVCQNGSSKKSSGEFKNLKTSTGNINISLDKLKEIRGQWQRAMINPECNLPHNIPDDIIDDFNKFVSDEKLYPYNVILPFKKHIDTIVLHHTAAGLYSHNGPEKIQSVHMFEKGKGLMDDISYNFLIAPDQDGACKPEFFILNLI